MSDLPERLRALATSLEGDEWEHPVTAREDCLAAAEEIERSRAALEPFEVVDYRHDEDEYVAEQAVLRAAEKVRER